MEPKELARRVRAARHYAGMSRLELARHLEIHERTQINSELGHRQVKGPERRAIAEATGVPKWFLEDGWDGWAKQLREAAAQQEPVEGRDPMQVAEEAVALVQGRPVPIRRRRTGS